MPTLKPISRERYGTKRWKRSNGYTFAASDAVAPLVISELPRATMTLPVGFVAQGDDFILSAVLGLTPGQNLFVLPDGRWQGLYIPAVFRGYPFALVPAGEDREVLCINEDSGLVTDGPEGEAFFGDEDAPSKSVADVLSFLQQLSVSGKATQRVCAALKEHGLIQPWPITIQTPSGDQRVDGLHRIDEAALNALQGDAFLKVRDAGGLPVAYCQLLSTQHLPALGQLAAARSGAAAPRLPVNEAGELDFALLNEGGKLDFSRLR